MNLDYMLLPLAGLIGLGVSWQRAPDARAPLSLAIIVLIWLPASRGYYWDLFGRGTGFFTANRLTAIAVFAGTTIASARLSAPKQPSDGQPRRPQ